ncbi:hypothetical protein FRC11_014166, partial [Ceratobasidium sp. 423]
ESPVSHIEGILPRASPTDCLFIPASSQPLVASSYYRPRDASSHPSAQPLPPGRPEHTAASIIGHNAPQLPLPSFCSLLLWRRTRSRT